MNRPELDAVWLALLLERNLRPVSAPDELWDRVRNPRVSRARTSLARTSRARSLTRLVLLVAAAVLIALVVFVPRMFPHGVAPSPQALAIDALTRVPDALDFRSHDGSAICAWVKARTGIALPLPSDASTRVRLQGVCAIKGAKPSVVVSYRVNGHAAALLVSQVGSATAGATHHGFLKWQSIDGTRVSSWIMRGQLYTLASAAPGDLRDECVLCHAGPSAVTAVN